MRRITSAVVTILCSLIPAAAAIASSIPHTECAINGVGIGDSVIQARRVLGPPLATGPECDGCFDIIDSWDKYDGAKLHYNGSALVQYWVTSNKFLLKSGVTVGSRREALRRNYGDPAEGSKEGQAFYFYRVTYEERDTRLELRFYLNDDVVERYELVSGG